MKSCPSAQTCAFMKCDGRYKSLQGIKMYQSQYCEGASQVDCVRYKLDQKYGAVRVPSNMMPNGLPLPGTHRRDWSTVALQHKKYLDELHSLY